MRAAVQIETPAPCLYNDYTMLGIVLVSYVCSQLPLCLRSQSCIARSEILDKALISGGMQSQDMQQAFPELAKGLQQLLDYPGDDVEAVFALSFEVEYDYFGEMRSHELQAGGSQACPLSCAHV